MKYWNASRCKELLEKGTVLALDIREPYEYQLVNCGFNNVPMASLIEFLKEKDRSTPLVLLCQSGKRSQAAGNLIETELGFLEVIIVEQGIQGWQMEVDPSLKLD
jgi:sulfur-carrier protein adenylyltransferase/sulfurtransferase